MIKQRSITLNKNDLVDLLKEKLDWLPDDLEICSVEQVPNSTLIVITIHSDSFRPLESNFTYFQFGIKQSESDWNCIEHEYKISDYFE